MVRSVATRNNSQILDTLQRDEEISCQNFHAANQVLSMAHFCSKFFKIVLELKQGMCMEPIVLHHRVAYARLA